MRDLLVIRPIHTYLNCFVSLSSLFPSIICFLLSPTFLSTYANPDVRRLLISLSAFCCLPKAWNKVQLINNSKKKRTNEDVLLDGGRCGNLFLPLFRNAKRKSSIKREPSLRGFYARILTFSVPFRSVNKNKIDLRCVASKSLHREWWDPRQYLPEYQFCLFSHKAGMLLRCLPHTSSSWIQRQSHSLLLVAAMFGMNYLWHLCPLLLDTTRALWKLFKSMFTPKDSHDFSGKMFSFCLWFKS